jgi:hypothetical protein
LNRPQCPHDLKWINGKANCKDWKPSDNDPNSGTGHYGTCCAEMDIWDGFDKAPFFGQASALEIIKLYPKTT